MSGGGEAPPPLRIGISSCLLGEEVRWNGGHQRDDALAALRGVEWVSVCPEVEIGFGVPREPIELVREGDELRLRGVESGRDLTGAMAEWAKEKLRALGDLDGYVLKSRSPSCGLHDVPVRGGTPGRGVFAAALVAAHPRLPVVEETDLRSAEQRARLLEQARAWRIYRTVTRGAAPSP